MMVLTKKTHECVHNVLKDAGVAVCIFKRYVPFEPRFHLESKDGLVVFVITMSGISARDMRRISSTFPRNVQYVSIDLGGLWDQFCCGMVVMLSVSLLTPNSARTGTV